MFRGTNKRTAQLMNGTRLLRVSRLVRAIVVNECIYFLTSLSRLTYASFPLYVRFYPILPSTIIFNDSTPR